MREFFKPRRRKIGMVTIMIALCISGAWIRSLIVQDNLHTPFLTLHIHGGAIAWFHSQNAGWRWDTMDVHADNWTGFMGVWRWSKDVIAAPFWVLLLPVVLLSTYLVFSKPRPANNPHTSSPPGPDHA